MIYKNLLDIKNKNFPVVIIGSGPAGITIATKLAKKKISSLIIEAGDEEYSDSSQQNYKSRVIGDEIDDLRYSRLRQLGGTSGHWGGWCKPIEKWNIEKWGLNYNEILNYENCRLESVIPLLKGIVLADVINISLPYTRRWLFHYSNRSPGSWFIA